MFFSEIVTLAKGDTVDFIVNTGPTTYAYLSTGFDAEIQLTSAVPEPSSLLLSVLSSLGLGVVAWFGTNPSFRSGHMVSVVS